MPSSSRSTRRADADAKLLIGDAALKSAFEDPTPHHDLGRLWLERTGLPMVFAVWAAPEPVIDGLVELQEALVASVRLARSEPERLAYEASERYGYPAGFLARYFEKLRYSFGPRERAGLYTFLEMARDVGELSARSGASVPAGRRPGRLTRGRMPDEPLEPAQAPPPETEVVAGKTLAGRALAAAERVRILREQIEEARARHRSVDIGLATVERDSEIGGSLLAGALAYRLFVFLLPFAVFLVVGLGVFADATDQSTAAVADDLGLTQVVAREIAGAANDSARWWVLIASVPILAYAIGQLFRSVSIVHALAYEGSGRAVKIKPRSIGLFGLAVVGQVVASNVAGALSADSVLGGVLGVVFAVAAVAGLWLGVSQLFPHGTSTVTERIPGALLYGVGNLAIFLFNTLFIGWLIEERQDSYGALGAAAALLFSMYLIGRLIVTSAVLNATIARRAAAAGSE